MALGNLHTQPSKDSVLAAVYRVLRDDPEALEKVRRALDQPLEAPSLLKSEGPIFLRLTSTVLRNYEHRAVFPNLRPQYAEKVLSTGAAEFQIAVQQAEDLLQDADEVDQDRTTPGGTKHAFTCLRYTLKRQIEEEKFRGCIEFPGEEKVQEERRSASALFKIGDRVDVWHDDGTKGKPATIVGPYGLYFASDEDGPYIRNGKKTIYCQGYRARTDDDQTFFYFARQLAPIGESYGHLRLVK